jgi:hypothetical protein
MKRFIAAVSFAVLATPAAAVEIGAPYEELNVDRALPEVVLPQEDAPAMQIAEASSVTSTRSDIEIAQQEDVLVVRSAWLDQHDFIAPAQ